MHFSLNQDRLQASGLSSQAVAQQLQFLLSGIPITTVREDIRAVQVIGRAAGDIRLDPAKIADFTLVGSGGQRVPLSQIGEVDVRMEEPCSVVATARRPLPSGEMSRITCSRRMSPAR
jgi:multidrug efflux pump subunit AcrB